MYDTRDTKVKSRNCINNISSCNVIYKTMGAPLHMFMCDVDNGCSRRLASAYRCC